MNERQHIALTEAQIIAAEKGELQLEYRNGEKVCQLLWYKPPYRQYRNCVRTIHPDGEVHNHYKTGIGCQKSDYDLFVSELAVDFSEQTEQLPKPLYEVGEIIEVREDDFSKWYEAEYLGGKNGQIAAWVGSCIDIFGEGHHRKKQTEKTVTLESKVMTVKEAFKYLTNLQ